MDEPSSRYGAAKLVLALRSVGVMDKRLAETFEKTNREPFVASQHRKWAWDNIELPIECGQTQTRPVTVAQIVQAMNLSREMKVLEVGTGSGYLAAIAGKLARSVYSIDRYRTIVERAQRALDTLGLSQVDVKFGDGLEGWPDAAPFDRIVVTSVIEDPPPALLEQLAAGGALLAARGEGPAQRMVKFVRGETGGLVETELFPTEFTPIETGVAKEL